MSEKTTGFFKSVRWISIALIAMLVLAVPSCEIGLGSAVDTESPTISISSPDQSSIIREDFKISGVCKDDVLVDHIAVVIKNTDNGTIYNPADIIPSAPLGKKLEQEWEFQANYKQEDGTWFLPDGNYTFSFTAWDAASRKSGEMIRSIVIDNTAPLLVLTRPSASDTYGQKFDITGQVADDNNIDLMLIDVYAYNPVTKERGAKLTAKPIELKNVPPTIDLTAAVYGDENYKAIYGDDKEAGNLNFCCDITIFDAARKFPAEEGDNGNSSNFYYMYNDIYTDLLSKYRMTQLYHMQSRALSYEDVPKAEQEAAVALLAKEVGAEGSIRSNTSAFTLNPLNNPTYEVIGYKPVTSFTALKRGSEFKISNGSQVTVKVSSGLDKTPIMNDTIGIKAFRVQQKGEDGWEPAELDADGKPVTYTIFPAYKDKDGNVLLTDSTAVAERAAAIKEVGSYDRTITINVISDENSGLIVGETYLFDVTAYDQNKNDIFNVDGNFGFFMASSGVAATLTINEPSANTLYINNDAETKLTFKGSTFHEEGKPTLKLNVKQYETGYSADFEIPEANLIQEGLAYNFTYELKPADFIPADKLSVSAQYDFSIVASYSGIDSSPINKTVMYDIGLPEINITNLTPVADTTVADAINGKQYNVNGEITIRGSFNDEDTAIDSDTMKYKYKKADGTWCEPKDVTKQQNFSVKIDTTELADKADLEVIFMVKDKAGNEKQETVYYEGTTKYFVDQSTDNPIVAVQDFKEKDEQGNTEPYKGFNTTTQSSKMTGQITDDDGIKKITIQCLTKDSGYTSNFVSDSVTYPVTPINITNPAEYKNAKYQYNLSQDLPSMKGNYKLVFDVEDIYGTTTKWSCLVRISGNAPEISDITKDRTHLAVSTNGVKEVVVTGNISGEHTAANPLTLFAAKSLDENGVPENKVKVWEVTDPSYTSGDTVSWTHTFSMTDAAFPLNTKADGSAVTDGNVKIYLQAEDSAGIASAVKEFVFTADNILPVVETLSSAKNAAGYITAASSPFGTTFTDANNGTEYFWQISNTAPAAVNSYADLTAANGWTMANAGTTNTFYGSFKEKGAEGNGLEEGAYNVYVIAVDRAQNVSLPKSEDFKVDLKAPVITISNNAETAKAAFALSGKVEDTYGFGTVATVSVKESGQESPVDLQVSPADGTWTSNAGAFPTTGADGIYTYTVSAKDAAGNPATPVSYSVTFDKTAPTVEILTPASDTTWLNAPAETKVSGRVSDGTGVGVEKVYYKLGATASTPAAEDPATEGWTLIGSDANWEVTVTTGSEGEAVQTIWVCAKDKLGNICDPVKRQINVDTATPVITLKKVEDVSAAAKELTANSGTYYSKGSFRITVEATDTNLDTVKCNNADTTAAGNNLYTYTASATGDYEFVATDKAGKTKPVTVNIKVDGTAPVVSALTSSDKNANGYITSTPSPFHVEYSDNDGAEGVELYWKISASVPAAATYTSKAALVTAANGWTKVNGDTFYGNFKTKGAEGNGIEEGASYNAYVVAVDRADNVSALKNLAFGVDLNAPVITITNTAAEVKAQFALSGTVTDSIGNGSVTKVSVKEGNAAAKEFTVTDGAWTSGATKFPTANTDGTYTYTVSATDAAGNTAAVKTYTVKFDNTAPSVSISKPTDGEWIAGDGTAAVTVIGTAMDGSGVGVEKVYYNVGETAATPAAGVVPTTAGWTVAGGTSDNWSVSVTPGSEGKAVKTVWIFAEDKLGNRSTAVSREINVDNAAPTVTNAKVYYVNGGTSTPITAKNGTYYVKGNFKITVDAADTNALKATAPVTCSGTAISGSNGTYTYNGTESGTYEFRATDIAEKESTVLKVNVTVDAELPESELEVKTLIDDYEGHVNEHVVNGEVTIKGTSSDNDKIDSVTLKIYQGTESGTLKCSVDSTTIASDAVVSGTSDKLLTAVDGNKNESATFKMDSTKLATGKYTIVYEVKDRTGNEAVKKTQEIYVDQNSDIPKLNFEDETDSSIQTTVDVNAGGNGKNLLGTDDGNRKIKFSASDDDGAPTVKVWSRKWDSSKTEAQQTAWTSTPQQTFTSTSFNYVIPKNAGGQVEEGFYQIRAEIADKNGLAGTSYTFMVGVSSGAPVVNISKNELTFVKGTSAANAEGVNITVKYKGGTSLTRKVELASGEPTGTGFTGVSTIFNPPANTASFQSYENTVKAYCSDGKSAKVTVTYTAKNMFNEEGSASYTFLIDNVKPVINEYATGKKFKVNGNEYSDTKWNQDNKFEFYAGWKDAGSTDPADEAGYTHSSEVTAIKYWFTQEDTAPTGEERGTFAPSKNGAVYELNNRSIQGFEEGINYLWLKAVDGAGNESAAFEKLIIKVDSAAPVVTLDKTGNVYVKPDTTDATKIKNIVITGKLVDQNITDENAADLRLAQGKSSGLNAWHPIRVFKGSVPDAWPGDAKKDYLDYRTSYETDADWELIKPFVKDETRVAVDATYHYKNEIAILESAVNADGTFSVTIPEMTVAGAPYDIFVVGSDYKDNHGKAQFKLMVDKVAPTVSIGGPKGRIGQSAVKESENPVTIFGSASDADSKVKEVFYQIRTDNTVPTHETDGWESAGTTEAWSKTLAAAQPQGKYKLYVYAEDNAGNKSPVSAANEYHIDYADPTAKIKVNGGAEVTYEATNLNVAQDVITNADNFKFKYSISDTYGIDTTASALEIKKDGVTIPKVAGGNTNGWSVDGNGNVTLSGTYLSNGKAKDGTYEFTVTAVDLVGKKTEVKRTVKLDTTGPVVTITAPTTGADEWQPNTQLKVGGSVEDASAIGAIWLKTATTADAVTLPTTGDKKLDTTWTGWTKINAAGTSWSYTVTDNGNQVNPTFADGTTYLNFAAVDEYGNVTEMFNQQLNIDSDTPSLKVTTDGTTEVTEVVSSARTTLKMVPADNHIASVTISGTGIAEPQVLAAPYSFQIPDTEGKYSYAVIAKDKAGREAQKNVTVVYDKTAPTVTASYITTSTKDAASPTVYPATWTKDNKMTLKASITNTEVSGIDSADYFISETSYDITNASDPKISSVASGDWNSISVSGNTVSAKDITLSDNTANDKVQYVYTRVTDKAGNVGYAKSATGFKVDTTAPSGYVASPTTGTTIGKNKAVSVSVSAADNTTGCGIAATDGVVIYVEGTADTFPATLTEGTYNGSIPVEKLAGYVTGGKSSLKIYARITDAAGNYTETSKVDLKFDNAAPTVSIINPAAQKDDSDNEVFRTVNGKINLSGSATDDLSTLSKVTVYRSPVDSETTAEVILNNTTNPVTKENLIKIQEFTGNSAYAWTVVTDETSGRFNTSELTDEKDYTIYVVAEDAAGNIGYSTRKIHTDQDSDRPLITFKNLVLKKTVNSADTYMSSTNLFWHMEELLRGSATDDDGITSMSYTINGGTPVTISDPGSWEIPFSANDQGDKTIEFTITDADGTTFTTAAAPDATNGYANIPKLRDTSSNELAAKDAATDDTMNSIVYIKVDTQNPQFVKKTEAAASQGIAGDDDSVYFRTDKWWKVNAAGEPVKADGTTKLTAEEIAAGQYVFEDDVSKWTKATLINGTVLGGPGSKLYVMATVSDGNGIQSLTAKLGDGTNDVSGTVVYASDAVNGTPAGTTDDTKVTRVFEIDTEVTSEKQTLQGKTYGKLILEVKDNANNSNKREETVNLDNVAPNLQITSTSDGATLFGSQNNFIEGTTDSANRVYFAIQKLDEAQDEPAIDSSRFTEIVEGGKTGALAWKLAFADSEPPTYYKVHQFNGYWSNAGDTLKHIKLWFYAKDALGNTSEKKSLELYIDPVGDRPSVEISYPYAPVGDILSSVGGLVRITGSSELQPGANATVSGVYVQIDPSYDAETGFATDWERKLNELIVTYEGTGYVVTDWRNPEDSSSMRGIRATGTPTNWNLTINKAKEFDKKEEGDPSTRTIAIRVYAITGSKCSQPVTRVFTIDADAPKIGSARQLMLKQYAEDDTTVTAQVAYTENMWITGEWYLTASVEDDDSCIKSITIDGTDILTDTTKSDWFVRDDESAKSVSNESNSGTFYNYDLKIPVGYAKDDTTHKSGKIEYTILATDASVNETPTSQKIIIYYDNEAPQFAVSNLAATGNKFQDSNTGYTLSGTFSDVAQSGFERIVFYLTRGTDFIDPLTNLGADGNANVLAQTGFDLDSEDHLYWTEYEVDKDSEGNLKIDGGNLTVKADLDSRFRVGSLAKVAGHIYRINAVSEKTITVDGTLPSDAEKAYFTVAQVIDNVATETSKDGGDLDGMQESVQVDGTGYNWTAVIRTTNIYDGALTMNFVAFDKAGNATALVTKAGTVSNNAPRITGYRYGTDENGDGNVAGTELRTDLSSLITKDGQLVIDHESSHIEGGNTVKDFPEQTDRGIDGSAGKPIITLKGKTEIKPEIVGGNGQLNYSYTVNTNAFEKTATKLKDAPDDLSVFNTDYIGGTITIPLSEFLGNASASIPDGEDTFEFTITDATSQECKFGFIAKVDIRDNKAPIGRIHPFFWRGKGKNATTGEKLNSLFEGDTANGHIELESDWQGGSGYVSTATSGTTDGDPKVSGKIVLTGTAEDNTILEGLWFYIKGFTPTGTWTAAKTKTVKAKYGDADAVDEIYYKLASYSSSGWTTEIAYAADVFTSSNYYLTVTPVELGDNGHKVNWELGINTEAINNVADNDVVVRIMVSDRGSPTITNDTTTYAPNFGVNMGDDGTTPWTAADATNNIAETIVNKATNTTAAAKTAYYRMDVVPYITKVTTGRLASIDAEASTYGRTSTGRYPVGTDETDLKVEGFNFGTNATISDGHSHTITGYSSGTAKAIGSMESGDWKVTVNGVDSINNINNNNASGSSGKTFTATTDDYDDLRAYAYNRAPNTTNNYRLTDDFKVDVWQISPNVVTPNRGELNDPVMHVNPANDLIGFSFLNGDADFSMPTGTGSKYYTSYKSGAAIEAKSYQWWQHNYADFNSNGFEYDEDGAAYACVAGLDTEPESKLGGRFTFMTSKWGTGNLSAKEDNYQGNNTVIFESIGLQNCIVQGTQYNDLLLTTKRFIGSPSFATAVHGTGDNKTTTVYLAYYDDIQGQIRFKYGELGSSAYNSKVCDEYTVVNDNKKVLTGGNWNDCAEGAKFIINGEVYTVQRRDWRNNRMELTFDKEIANNGTKVQCKIVTFVDGRSTKSEFGNFENRIDFNGKYINDNKAYESHTNQWALIAGKDYQQGTSPNFYDTGYKAYRYVDIACVKGNTAADDTIHAVWYDGKDCYYSYIVNPTTGIDMGKEAVNGVAWATPKKIFTKGGEYCQIAVDPMGGIHIAAACSYKLKYAYLANKEAAATYSEATNSCLVDGYQLEGTRLQLEVLCKDVTVNGTSTKVAVPYISYFMMSTQLPKMAYLNIADTITSVNHVPAGTDGNVKYTGDWEISLVPTGNNVNDDRVNIGVWKNANGYAKTSYTTGTSSKDTGNKNGIVYGNGKAYPVIGYVCRDGSDYGIEIAQKK